MCIYIEVVVDHNHTLLYTNLKGLLVECLCHYIQFVAHEDMFIGDRWLWCSGLVQKLYYW